MFSDVLGWQGLRGSVFFYSEPVMRILPPYMMTILCADLGGLLTEVLVGHSHGAWRCLQEWYCSILGARGGGYMPPFAY